MVIYNLLALVTTTSIENGKIAGSGMEAALLNFVFP